jgi:coenzyme PQQ precursor peptide PqqA
MAGNDKHVISAQARYSIPPLAAFARCANVGCKGKGNAMAWTTPIIVEICVGLEINGYLPAEF